MTLNIKKLGEGGVVSFKVWTEEENETWRLLCERQMKNLKGKVSRVYLEGWNKLGLSTDKIPDFNKVNEILADLNGWQVVMTDIVYEDNNAWICSLKEKKFRVTNFIRDRKDLDYTPLPDIFHDVFGHMPFLGVPQYTRILEKFGEAANLAREKGDLVLQDEISHLGWFGYEFGFMDENNEPKAFGTGLVSSFGELMHALKDETPKVPYTPEEVVKFDLSPDKFHAKYFVLNSLDEFEKIIDEWVAKAKNY